MKRASYEPAPRVIPAYLLDARFIEEASVSSLCRWLLDLRAGSFLTPQATIAIADLLSAYESLQWLEASKGGLSLDLWLEVGDNSEQLLAGLRERVAHLTALKAVRIEDLAAFAEYVQTCVARARASSAAYGENAHSTSKTSTNER